MDLPFRDETGRVVTLGEYFNHQKPVVLTLVYFDCPLLCTQVLNGVAGAIKGMGLRPGQDYDLVTISFNPRDTTQGAVRKKALALKWYGHPEAAPAWHFLTGEETAIRVLTEAVGFHYVYDATTGQYAHATGLMVATPDGRLAKYLYGIEYAPRDLRLAIVDASGGRIGTPVDKLLLYCYHYDPTAGKYGLVVLNVVRLGGVVTVVLLGSFIAAMTARDRRRNRQGRAGQAGPPPVNPSAPRATD
jgi:protein SCO1/2